MHAKGLRADADFGAVLRRDAAHAYQHDRALHSALDVVDDGVWLVAWDQCSILSVRAIDERFYGRTARLFYVSVARTPEGEDMPRDFNDFEVAASESVDAFLAGKLWGFIRHARITEAEASAFWERMAELVGEFDRLPRSGDTTYGFAIGVYPTDLPTLPTA